MPEPEPTPEDQHLQSIFLDSILTRWDTCPKVVFEYWLPNLKEASEVSLGAELDGVGKQRATTLALMQFCFGLASYLQDSPQPERPTKKLLKRIVARGKFILLFACRYVELQAARRRMTPEERIKQLMQSRGTAVGDDGPETLRNLFPDIPSIEIWEESVAAFSDALGNLGLRTTYKLNPDKDEANPTQGGMEERPEPGDEAAFYATLATVRLDYFLWQRGQGIDHLARLRSAIPAATKDDVKALSDHLGVEKLQGIVSTFPNKVLLRFGPNFMTYRDHLRLIERDLEQVIAKIQVPLAAVQREERREDGKAQALEAFLRGDYSFTTDLPAYLAAVARNAQSKADRAIVLSDTDIADLCSYVDPGYRISENKVTGEQLWKWVKESFEDAVRKLKPTEITRLVPAGVTPTPDEWVKFRAQFLWIVFVDDIAGGSATAFAERYGLGQQCVSTFRHRIKAKLRQFFKDDARARIRAARHGSAGTTTRRLPTGSHPHSGVADRSADE